MQVALLSSFSDLCNPTFWR